MESSTKLLPLQLPIAELSIRDYNQVHRTYDQPELDGPETFGPSLLLGADLSLPQHN
jgi:hypothetical protein